MVDEANFCPNCGKPAPEYQYWDLFFDGRIYRCTQCGVQFPYRVESRYCLKCGERDWKCKCSKAAGGDPRNCHVPPTYDKRHGGER
jgi:hypothetical protein